MRERTLADKLRPFVAALQAGAAAGDVKATEVIKLYQMHVRCSRDPVAPAICEEVFDQWLAERQETADA